MAGTNYILEDSSEKGIESKLYAAYRRILDKSTRKDFHLYVSGYPSGFFGDDDAQPTDCKNTIFNHFRPSYCPHWYMPCFASDNIYLTVALRQELNNLVVRLNQVIEAAVDRANHDAESSQVHFVDVGPYYDNHRFCEESNNPNFHEPNENRMDTWYFLSGWKDVDATNVLGALGGLGGNLAIHETENRLGRALSLIFASQNATNDVAEANALVDQGSIQLPPATSCKADLGTDPDPYAKWMCMVSHHVYEDPTGPMATKLKEANAAIAAKEYTSESVGWFTPTRQIKTFHPRTPGMHAYRQSIVDAINKHQVNT